MKGFSFALASFAVAPYAGAWIEMRNSRKLSRQKSAVAPYAGAWIEIKGGGLIPRPQMSLPTRERGLKYKRASRIHRKKLVAPYAGAWIEISASWFVLIFPSSLPTREQIAIAKTPSGKCRWGLLLFYFIQKLSADVRPSFNRAVYRIYSIRREFIVTVFLVKVAYQVVAL